MSDEGRWAKAMKAIALFAFVTVLLCGCGPHQDEAPVLRRSDEHGFYSAFERFRERAQAGDFHAVAEYLSPEIRQYLGAPFEDLVAKGWKMSRCEVRTAVFYDFGWDRAMLAEIVLELDERKSSDLKIMHWVRRGGKWMFLDFPFSEAGAVSAFHAFTNESMASIVDDDNVEGR